MKLSPTSRVVPKYDGEKGPNVQIVSMYGVPGKSIIGRKGGGGQDRGVIGSAAFHFPLNERRVEKS